MIKFKDAKKVYKSKKGVMTTALDNINLTIGNRGMVFIVGKSGSGKSTLLNIIGGLDTLTEGELSINGNDISQFTGAQYDAYRNTYLGFIFQEFNILEQYNVCQNIELALKLQNQSAPKKTIDDLLDQIGLTGLGERNINELSGGQKQRVAIARALIKKPRMILADEPTGNLDKSSGEQIFQILKNISKEQLVIVVSHDREAAALYADRIIEIEDGKVSHDTHPIDDSESHSFELKKSKLPLSYAIKMSMTTFKTKPMKLLMTIFLTAIALIFMGFSVNCALFDRTLLVTDTMKQNKNYVYDVQNSKFESNNGINPLELKKEDYKAIQKITNRPLNPAYILYDNGEILHFEFGENDQTSAYYPYHIFDARFIETTDTKIIGNIIGKYPEKSNEIVVHKYFADYAIQFGIRDAENQLYFPKDYRELVSTNKEIKLGENKVIIVGIVDDDTRLFEKAKESGKFESRNLEYYFSQSYPVKSRDIYTKGFIDTAILKTDKTALLKYIAIVNNGISDDQISVSDHIEALQESIDVITQNGVETIHSLEKNQLILSTEALKKFDQNFDTEFTKYLETHRDGIYEELLKEFTTIYLKENSQTINLRMSIYTRDFEFDKEPSSLSIAGISFDGNNYISYQYLEEYQPISKKVYSVKIFDDNPHNLNKSLNNLVFRDFSDHIKEGTYYNYSVANSTDLANIMTMYKDLAVYILIFSLVFVLFTFLLFSNFIFISISYCKKEIGILRALGATNRDVIKIFGYESIFIGILAWGLSMIGWVVLCHLLNQSLFGSMYYTLNGIITHPLVPLIMFLYMIVISSTVTFVSVNRITSIKPIDAILNK